MDITNVLNTHSIRRREFIGVKGVQKLWITQAGKLCVWRSRVTRSTKGLGNERGIMFMSAFDIRLPLGITMPINNYKRRHNAISLESVLFPARLCIFWFMWLPRLLRLVILDRIIDEAHDAAHAFLILHIQLQELYQAEVVY